MRTPSNQVVHEPSEIRSIDDCVNFIYPEFNRSQRNSLMRRRIVSPMHVALARTLCICLCVCACVCVNFLFKQYGVHLKFTIYAFGKWFMFCLRIWTQNVRWFRKLMLECSHSRICTYTYLAHTRTFPKTRTQKTDDEAIDCSQFWMVTKSSNIVARRTVPTERTNVTQFANIHYTPSSPSFHVSFLSVQYICSPLVRVAACRIMPN